MKGQPRCHAHQIIPFSIRSYKSLPLLSHTLPCGQNSHKRRHQKEKTTRGKEKGKGDNEDKQRKKKANRKERRRIGKQRDVEAAATAIAVTAATPASSSISYYSRRTRHNNLKQLNQLWGICCKELSLSLLLFSFIRICKTSLPVHYTSWPIWLPWPIFLKLLTLSTNILVTIWQFPVRYRSSTHWYQVISANTCHIGQYF